MSLLLSLSPNFFFNFKPSLNSQWGGKLKILCSVVLISGLSACSSAPVDTSAGIASAVVTQAETPLDEQANYIYAKNASRKLAAMNINVVSPAFLMAVKDVMSGSASRVPTEDYNQLITNIRKNASPLATSIPVDLTKPNLPEGLREAEERVSYMTARPIAQHFIKNGIPIITERMEQGLKDASTGQSSFMTPVEERAAQQQINEKLRYARTDWTANRDAFYEREEAVFFATNKAKPGVVTLESGVQYLILHQGTGKLATEKNTVSVHYQGTLLDGSVFDSSYTRNNPAIFPMRSLIRGFREALQYLPEGSKAVIYIPAKEAYKDEGTPQIPPKAAIKFEIELFSVK